MKRLKVSEDTNFAIASGSTCPGIAMKIAETFGKKLVKIRIKKFLNSEPDVLIEESVRGKTIFLIQTSLTGDFSGGIMETLVINDALSRAGAKKVILCQLCYPGARQDRREPDENGKPKRRPITAKLFADLIQNAGIKGIITVHLHSGQIEGFFQPELCRIENISPLNIFVEHLQAQKILNGHNEDVMLLAPDAGAGAAVSKLTRALNLSPYGIVDKDRPKPGQSDIMNIIGNVEGMRVIIWDDMVDTGGTAVKSADKVLDMGAKEVMLLSTHPVLSDNASKKLINSPFSRIVFSDTLPVPGALLQDVRVTQLSIVPLIADVLANFYNDESLEELVRINTATLYPEISTQPQTS